MKALVLHGINDLRLENVADPQPDENEVLLKIHACGICSSDEDRILKTGTYHFPTIPGHEFAGEIVGIGKGVSKELLGKKASVFPLLPCMKCTACKNEEYQMCQNYKYFGSRNDGGFAEYLSIPVWNIVLLDDKIDYCVGALMEPAAVSLHAVNIGKVSAGQKVSIIGTGTIGLLIGFFCKKNGADVYICGRRQESIDNAKKLGFKTINVNCLEEEVDKETHGRRMDVVFEAVGTNRAMEESIISATNVGTIVAVGNPKGDFCLSKDVYWKILRKQLIIKGTWNSDYGEANNDWRNVAEIMKEEYFYFEKLISKKYRIDDFEQAFKDLSNKDISKSKLMLIMSWGE